MHGYAAREGLGITRTKNQMVELNPNPMKVSCLNSLLFVSFVVLKISFCFAFSMSFSSLTGWYIVGYVLTIGISPTVKIVIFVVFLTSLCMIIPFVWFL
jgi:hypothetical protein